MAKKDLMSLLDLSKDEINETLQLAMRYKKERGQQRDVLAGKSIGLIFLKNSTRTRVSFEVGVNELGASPLYLDQNSLQIGRGESFHDTAKVLSRYLHGIVIRGHEHDDIAEFAAACDVPVINALTDRFHPCQLLADMQTILERRGSLEGAKVAYLGDCNNNMSNSWLYAAAQTGMDLRLGGPAGYLPADDILASVNNPSNVTFTESVEDAVRDADFVVTDVWISMGFEEEAKKREKIFMPYQINKEIMQVAAKDAKIMHCLPAYRGKEITADTLEGPQSIVWDEAENRLHAQKAVMKLLFS
jgi:ornithine carbamoyltransferase